FTVISSIHRLGLSREFQINTVYSFGHVGSIADPPTNIAPNNVAVPSAILIMAPSPATLVAGTGDWG
ncbi:MAG: hypothetical protein WCR06_12265, partial [bacterium]